MTEVFFSYSHKDETWRDQLEVHLAMLRREGTIAAWHDRRIDAGEDFNKEISRYLESAGIILLLVSSDFLASEYCYEKEMMRAMERHEQKKATVIPIILRPCDWHSAPFGKLLAAPKDGKAISTWANLDEAFLDVVKSLRKALTNSKQSQRLPPTLIAQALTESQSDKEVRSSNLRVTKNFTDKEKDQFRYDGFEYLTKFFENSLFELEARNKGIEGIFKRIDANRFTAVVYRDGVALSRCTIFITDGLGFGGDIGYASNDSGKTNGLNFSLSVRSDEQSLFFNAGLGFWGASDEREQKLTFQGAAEQFWGKFIEPLQR